MRLADISLLIILQMYSKRKRYILRAVLIFLVLIFSALMVGLRFFEKKTTLDLFRPEYIE